MGSSDSPAAGERQAKPVKLWKGFDAGAQVCSTVAILELPALPSKGDNERPELHQCTYPLLHQGGQCTATAICRGRQLPAASTVVGQLDARITLWDSALMGNLLDCYRQCGFPGDSLTVATRAYHRPNAASDWLETNRLHHLSCTLRLR